MENISISLAAWKRWQNDTLWSFGDFLLFAWKLFAGCGPVLHTVLFLEYWVSSWLYFFLKLSFQPASNTAPAVPVQHRCQGEAWGVFGEPCTAGGGFPCSSSPLSPDGSFPLIHQCACGCALMYIALCCFLGVSRKIHMKLYENTHLP